MKVVVSRSGGFAGMRITWQVRIDDRPDADEWIVLLSRLPWDEVESQKPQSDRFVYRISCEEPPDAAEPSREATLAEQQVQGPWRELVDRVREADGRSAAEA